MIERLEHPKVLARPGEPVVVASKVARLPCDCRAYMGALVPLLTKPAVASRACSDDHEPLIANFRVLFSDTDWRKGGSVWTEVEVDSLLGTARGLYEARLVEERKVGA